MDPLQCSVMSLTDTELMALIDCAKRRLIVIAPGLSEMVARALANRWEELGSAAVKVVLDPDPEVCRLGLGDVAALKLLHDAARQMGTSLLQQSGLRVGIIVTDQKQHDLFAHSAVG